MEEADKVPSSAPDEAPHDVVMNEAAAVEPTPAAEEEGMPGKTSPPQTTEETSPPQTTEITSSPQTTEETSPPQTTEITSSPQTTEITSSPQTSEETSPPQTTEITSVSKITEESSSPQTTEKTSASEITKETSPPQSAEVNHDIPPQSADVTSSLELAEESVVPVSEVPVKRTSTEAGVTATDPVIPEAAVTPEPVTPEPVTPEPVTPAVSEAVTPPTEPRTEAREEPASSSSEEKHPLTPPAPRAVTFYEPEPVAPPVCLPAAPALQPLFPSALQLLYWRDVRSSALIFGSSLFLLLSLSCCSIISVVSYSALALLSLTLSFRVYKGVLQAVQKSDDGHPFKWVLEQDVCVSSDAVQRHSEAVLIRINGALKELRRLFLVEDLIDSLKLAGLLWVFTYIGAWFNGLTLLILGLVGAFSAPLTYEKHQTQIDQFLSSLSAQVKDVMGKIQAMVPGAKKKPE